jgi:hypothetical protein
MVARGPELYEAERSTYLFLSQWFVHVHIHRKVRAGVHPSPFLGAITIPWTRMLLH